MVFSSGLLQGGSGSTKRGRLVGGVLLSMLAASAWAQSNTPREETWVTNGSVNAIVCTPDTVYIGGNFTYVGPPTGYGVPLDAGTGQPAEVYPKVNGTVSACVPDGSGGWYIGGAFTQVGSVGRNNIAHILSEGSVDSNWNPSADNTVNALALSGTTVYAGGQFAKIGEQTRNGIAALDATTGFATPWNPNATGGTVLALTTTETTVFAGGQFTSIGGQSRNRIAALDMTTALATAWNPNANGAVNTLVVLGPTVYAGGSFTNIGGLARNDIAALDATTGLASAWNPNANGAVNILAASGTTVYAGGGFTSIGGLTRKGIAALDATTGAATAWMPVDSLGSATVQALAVSGTKVYAGGSFSVIGGEDRNNIVALDATSGYAWPWDPNADAAVKVLAVSGTTVYAGGSFPSIGGKTRHAIAALDANTGAATDWNPDAYGGNVSALAVSGSRVYVGGSFISIGGSSGDRYLAALDTATGLATWDWTPSVNNYVNALAVSGTTVYIGGQFTTASGAPRNHIAALSARTGTATVWNPNAGDTVNTIVVEDTNIYVGGFFTSIGGLTRNYIAALDATTGLATPWDPNAGGAFPSVWALAVSGPTVFVGGGFTSIGGQTRDRIAALDAATGLATAWNPNADGIVMGLAMSGMTVYAGGGFSNIGGQPRNRIAALDVASGLATAWNPAGSGGAVQPLAVSGTTVYAGGGHSFAGNPYFAQFDADALAILPADDFSASGIPGGPFTPSIAGYTLRNRGTSPFSWTVETTQPWTTLSRTDGTLAGGAWADITVAINANAAGLPKGTYTDVVTFTDTTTGCSFSRNVTLTVTDLIITPLTGFNSAGQVGGPSIPNSQTYTIMNAGTGNVSWTAETTQPWLSVAPASGTLISGTSVPITVTINAKANGLPASTYLGCLTVTDVGTGQTVVRQASLSVRWCSRWYVDGRNTSGTQDGLTWATAFPTIEQAVGAARRPSEIWVAAGTYASTSPCDLGSSINMYGGFAGNETSLDQRDWNANITSFSPPDGFSCSETVFDGFHIVNETRTGSVVKAVYAQILHCSFEGNTVLGDPDATGGLHAEACTISGCQFLNNAAIAEDNVPGAALGGAVYSTACQISDCTFANNTCRAGHGASYVSDCSGGNAFGGAIYGGGDQITNCIFVNCSSSGGDAGDSLASGDSGGIGAGGAVSEGGATAVIEDCVFIGCASYGGNGGLPDGAGGDARGGAVQATPSTLDELLVFACSFSGNSVLGGTGLGVSNNGAGLGAAIRASECQVRNAIVTESNPLYPISAFTCTYSDIVAGGIPGTGNISADPRFLGAADLHLHADSPCVDAGIYMGTYPEPAADIEGTPRPQGAGVDMGAYEDHDPGAVSIACVDANPTNAASVDFVVTFSEPVSGVAPSDFVAASNGPAGAYIADVLSADGKVYSVTVATGSGDGRLGLNLVDDDSIVDADGTPLGGQNPGNGDFTGAVLYTIDKTPPAGAVVINGNAVNANSLSVTLTLPADDGLGSGVCQMKFSNDGSTWSPPEPYGDTKPWTLAEGADGSRTVYVKYQDNAGNWSNAFSSDILLDTVKPAPLVIGSNGLTNAIRTLVIAFGERVQGFSLPGGISVTNGIPSNLQATGTPGTYTVDILGSGTNTVSVSIPAGVATDDASNPNDPTTTPFTYPFDDVAPTAVITGSTTLTNAVRTLTIDFGETVNGFGLGGISVTNGTASNLQPAGSSSSYTVDVMGSGTVIVSVSIAGSVVTDDATNPNTPTVAPFIFPFDDVATTPMIMGATTLTNSTRTLTIAFGENMNGFSLPGGISVTNGIPSNLQATGTPGTYTVDILGSGTNTVSVSIPAGVATDDASNPNDPTAAPFTYPFDDVAPTAVITGSTTLTNAVRTLTIDFGETVNGFGLGGISVTNGTASNLQPAGSSSSYTVDVMGSGTVIVSVSIAGSVVTDDATNPNTPTVAPFIFPFDDVATTPVITGASTLTNTTRTLTIAFGENMNGFSLPGGISVTNGIASNLQPTGTPGTYTVDILGSGTNTVSVSIPAGVATDDASNQNDPTAAPFTYPFDDVAPTALITLDDPTPTGLDVVHFIVDFNQSVGTTFDAFDVTVTGTLSGTPLVGGSDPNYTVTVTLSNPNANGTIGISVGTEVTDLAGNPYAGGSSLMYTIANWPGFTMQPADARKYEGDSYTFDVAIGPGGGGTVAYQWKWDDGLKTIHNGPTTPTWVLTGLTTANRGEYWCEVVHNSGVYPTRYATLSVEEHLEITGPPTGGQEPLDASHTFSVQSTGGFAPLTYAWEKDGTTIPDASEASYTRSDLTTLDSGTYTVEVSDANSDVRTASADLTVTQGVPVAGIVGLMVLSTLLALSGGRSRWRKRHREET